MVLLRSNERFNDVVELDEGSGVWRKTTRLENVPSKTDGFYSILSEVFFALFRSGNQLYVRIGDTQIELTEDVKVTVSGPPENRLITLIANGTRISHTYSLSSASIAGDITPFVEDEDSDFGLFLSNIVGSPERQAILRSRA